MPWILTKKLECFFAGSGYTLRYFKLGTGMFTAMVWNISPARKLNEKKQCRKLENM